MDSAVNARALFQGSRGERAVGAKHVSSIIAWEVRAPENIGAIVRLAANFACQRVFFVEAAGTEHNHRRIRKTAVSAPSHLQWEFVTAAEFAATPIARQTIVGLETSHGSVDLREAQWPSECALMVGSESYGLPDEALALCAFTIHIPIAGPLKSLNVSHALAIALFDATYSSTREGTDQSAEDVNDAVSETTVVDSLVPPNAKATT